MSAAGSRTRTLTVGIGGALVAFAVAVVLHSYPKDVVTRHRFCVKCAEYEESYREGAILGATHGEKQVFGGAVRNLLKPAVGEHEHVYTPWATIHPTFGVPAEHPEVAERVRAIREIEGSPHAISLLEQAMRRDRDGTVLLIQRVIDPDNPLPSTVIAELDAPQPPAPPVEPVATTATVGPTKSFTIVGDRAQLDGHEIDLWGLRCGNALMDRGVTERHVRNLDNFAAHGINLVGVYVQGSNGGWPNVDAGRNGYERDGTLVPDFAERLEWLVREADARGMVVMVGLFSPRKDQELADEAAVQRAIEQTAEFLVDHQLANVFVDIMHEYDHERIDLKIFEEPDGPAKKAKLQAWWHAVAPEIEAGVCPTWETDTADSYPGMQVRIIQKEAEIPGDGFVVNVETLRHDPYENEGKYEPEEFATMQRYFEQYLAAPNAVMLFHSAWVQGITGKSGSGPHPEMGGHGKSEADRGIRFYFEWVEANVGRWEYPRHRKP